MAIQQIEDHLEVVEARGGLARASAFRSAIALATVWLAKLAASFDWGSPYLGAGIVFTAAASLVGLVAAKVARPRTLRSLAGLPLTLGVVAMLLAPGPWSVATLSTRFQGNSAIGGSANVTGSLTLGDGSVLKPGSGVTWVTLSSMPGAPGGGSGEGPPLIRATGQPVVVMGGFTGSDPQFPRRMPS